MFVNLFATPIYHNTISDNGIKNEIDSIIDDVKLEYREEWGQTHYISTNFSSNISSNALDEYNLMELKKNIHKNLIEYLKVLNYPISNLKYDTESWFSLFEKGNYAHIHSHGTADISGVYYYKTNKKDGDIFFEPPLSQLKQSKLFYNHSASWPLTPEEGKLIIFPGWLNHGVKTNTTESERISLSFNIRLR